LLAGCHSTLTSLSFSDRVRTITKSTVGLVDDTFEVWTNASGAITGWQFGMSYETAGSKRSALTSVAERVEELRLA